MAKISRRALAQYAAERLAVGENAAKLARQLAAVMVQTGRSDQIDLLSNDIAWELEQRKIAANTNIASVTPLPSNVQRQIEEFIKKSTKVQTVILHQQLEPSLIGGIRIDTASRSWDKSVKAALTEIREAF